MRHENRGKHRARGTRDCRQTRSSRPHQFQLVLRTKFNYDRKPSTLEGSVVSDNAHSGVPRTIEEVSVSTSTGDCFASDDDACKSYRSLSGSQPETTTGFPHTAASTNPPLGYSGSDSYQARRWNAQGTTFDTDSFGEVESGSCGKVPRIWPRALKTVTLINTRPHTGTVAWQRYPEGEVVVRARGVCVVLGRLVGCAISDLGKPTLRRCPFSQNHVPYEIACNISIIPLAVGRS